MAQPEAHASTRRWWIHPLRWLWLVLRFLWGTIILGVLVGILPTVLFLTKRTDPHTLIIGVVLDWVGHYWVLSLVVSLLLIALTVLTWVLVKRLDDAPALQPRAIAPDLLQRSRMALLRTLRSEYTRRLTHSLQGAAMLVLGLHERTDVTRSAAQLVFSRNGVTGAQPLPPGTSIVQAYDEAAGGLLVLGEAGAGKTTLLLDIASALLTRAAADPAHPIPVILNLSSWASKKPVLAAWLIDQLQLVSARRGLSRTNGSCCSMGWMR